MKSSVVTDSAISRPPLAWRPYISAWKFALLLAIGLSGGCNQNPDGGSATENRATAAPSSPGRPFTNQLEMRINGSPWRADREIHVSIDPVGMEGAVVIGGSFGPKDKNEQVFSLILQRVEAPGQVRIHSGDLGSGVVQIANLSPERYLIGSILGFDLAVTVETFSNEPVVVDLRFKGQLVDNNGNSVDITDGRLSYRE